MRALGGRTALAAAAIGGLLVADSTRIRERIALASDARERTAIRAEESLTALSAVRAGFTLTRGQQQIVFQRRPEEIRHPAGNVIGLDVLVVVYVGGVEQQVDPHRRILNTPTLVTDGTFRPYLTRRGDLVNVSNWREDPEAAVLQALRESLVDAPNPAGWNTAGTVTTIFGSTNDATVDSTSTVYTTARAGGTINAVDDTGLSVGQWFSSPTYAVVEAFLAFDTSSLAGQLVSAVAMGMWGFSDWSTANFNMQVRPYDFGAAVTSADWVPGANLGALTLLGSLSSVGFTVGGYNTIVENGANFANAINLAGPTSLVLSSDETAANSAPAGNEGLDFYSSDQAGTSNDPKLAITHVTGAFRRRALNINQSVNRAASW